MTVPTAVVIAVLGLGEAGSEVAADLVAAGATVHGFDPRVAAAPAGVLTFGSDAEAARGAAVVIALTSAHEAIETLELALPGVGPGAVYADLNTGSAGLKSALAAIAEPAGVAFTDIALMAPVPGLGLRTPMLASGPAAPEYAATFGALGATVTVLPGPPARPRPASWCAASSTKGSRPRSPRLCERGARPAARSGCELTSAACLPTRRRRQSIGLRRAASGTLAGGSTKWRRRPGCSTNSACRHVSAGPVRPGSSSSWMSRRSE